MEELENKAKQAVVALLRVSTAAQAADDRAGLERQMLVVQRICEERNLHLVDTIKIDDVSGTETHHCPEVIGMLARLQHGEIKGIVVADFDRLMRPEEFAHLALLDIFVKTKTLLHVSQMALDLSTDWGQDMAYKMVGDARRELNYIKTRFSGGKEVQRIRGRCPNSHVTLALGVGYDRKLQQWHYKEGIEKVETAFRLLDEGKCDSLASVAASIGMTPRGVAHVLRNKIYIGIKEYTWKRGEKYPTKGGRQSDRKKVRRTPNEIISTQVIPVPAIDPTRFKRVQNILDTFNSLWRVSRSRSRPHLGSSILVCSRCGRNLNCKPGKGDKGGYYVCASNDCYWRSKGCSCEQPTIPEKTIDKTLLDFLSEKLSNKQYVLAIVKHHIDSQHSNAQTSQISSEVTKETIKRLEGRLSRMEELYLDGGFNSVKEYQFKRKQTEDDLNKLIQQLIPENEPAPESFEPMLRRLIAGALAIRRTKDKKVQQSVIRGLIASITICDTQIMGYRLRPPVDVLFGEIDTRTDTGS